MFVRLQKIFSHAASKYTSIFKINSANFYVNCIAFNHYKTLGITETASQSDIKNAYIKLCMQCHPDRHPNDKVKAERFLKVSDAYNVLSSTTHRQEYDASLLRRSSFRHGSYSERERWSSAYRNHPHVRNEQRYRDARWQDPYQNNQRRTPRDRLDDYWDQFYDSNQKYDHKKKSNQSSQEIINPDNFIKVVVGLVFLLLFMRFSLAYSLSRHRMSVDEAELEKYREMRKQAVEAKTNLINFHKEKENIDKSETISNPQLEDA